MGTAREDMVAGAARLLAERGVQATSFNEVIALTGAPRGSIYHHFPGGKSQLVTEAVQASVRRAIEQLEALRGRPADEVATAFFGTWRSLLALADRRIGCSVAAVTVGAEGEPGALMRRAAGEAFAQWSSALASLLREGGIRAAGAPALADALLAGAEGAVLLARAQDALEPFDRVSEQMLLLVRAQLN